MIWRRRSPDDTMTEAQRERLQIVTVSGDPDGPGRWTTQCRLEFARTLAESGRWLDDEEEHDR